MGNLGILTLGSDREVSEAEDGTRAGDEMLSESDDEVMIIHENIRPSTSRTFSEPSSASNTTIPHMPNTSESLMNLIAINNGALVNTTQEHYHHYHYSSMYNQADPSYQQINAVGYNSNYYTQNHSHLTQYNYPHPLPLVQNNNYIQPQTDNNTPPTPFTEQYYPSDYNQHTW